MHAIILGKGNENSSFSVYDRENDPPYLSAERPDVQTGLMFQQRPMQQGVCLLH